MHCPQKIHFRFKDTNRSKAKKEKKIVKDIACKQQPEESWSSYANITQNTL